MTIKVRLLSSTTSRSAPIPDIYYFQNTPEVTSVQLSLTVLLTASWVKFYIVASCHCDVVKIVVN